MLFGGVDIVKITIDRIKNIIGKNEKVVLCFSGGKDSLVLYDIVKKCNINCDINFHNTTIEFPELYKYIKSFKDVKIINPCKSFFRLCIDKGIMPTRFIRFCCSGLKEVSYNNKIITGVRWAESYKRKNNRSVVEIHNNKKDIIKLNDNELNRKYVEICSMKSQVIINPIIDWTDEEVWEYIKMNKLNYCNLYNKGFKRLGCVGCVMVNIETRLKELSYCKFYESYYKRIMEKIIEKKIMLGEKNKFKTINEYWKYWIYGNCENQEQEIYRLNM